MLVVTGLISMQTGDPHAHTLSPLSHTVGREEGCRESDPKGTKGSRLCSEHSENDGRTAQGSQKESGKAQSQSRWRACALDFPASSCFQLTLAPYAALHSFPGP